MSFIKKREQNGLPAKRGDEPVSTKRNRGKSRKKLRNAAPALPPWTSEELAWRNVSARLSVVDLEEIEKKDPDDLWVIIGTLDAEWSETSYQPFNDYLETRPPAILVFFMENAHVPKTPEIEVRRVANEDGGYDWEITAYVPVLMFQKLRLLIPLMEQCQALDAETFGTLLSVALSVMDPGPLIGPEGEASDPQAGFHGFIQMIECQLTLPGE